MPQEAYGVTQVREILMTKAEVERMVLENFRARASTSYNFDYSAPIFVWKEDGSLSMRFVESEFTREKDPKIFPFKSLAEVSDELARRIKK